MSIWMASISSETGGGEYENVAILVAMAVNEESIYPFIFMDAIHYKVKEDHRYVTKAAYVVLGIWIGEHESSKF